MVIKISDRFIESSPQKPKKESYHQDNPYLDMDFNNQYLEILMEAQELKVIKVQKGKKPLVVFEEPISGSFLLFLTKGEHNTIGLIADYLGINRRELNNLVSNGDRNAIQNMLKSQGTRKILIVAHLYKRTYFIHNIATEKYKTIRFMEVKEALIEFFPGMEIIEVNIGINMFWEVPYDYFGDNFDIFIRILSGRNIKTRAVKIILVLKIGQVEAVFGYSVIEHTQDWKERFFANLSEITNIASELESYVTEISNIPLTLDEINNLIDNIINNMSIKMVNKVNYVDNLLRNGIVGSYKSKKVYTLLDFVKDLSSLADLIDPNLSSKFTKEYIKDEAFKIILGD